MPFHLPASTPTNLIFSSHLRAGFRLHTLIRASGPVLLAARIRPSHTLGRGDQRGNGLASPDPAGSNLYVFFDPASQWYAVSMTMAAGWLRAGGGVSYNAFAQSPDSIRLQLKRFGLDKEDRETMDHRLLHGHSRPEIEREASD